MKSILTCRFLEAFSASAEAVEALISGVVEISQSSRVLRRRSIQAQFEVPFSQQHSYAARRDIVPLEAYIRNE